MKSITTIFKRELLGYFETPVAYVFIVVFLLLSGIFTFYIGSFYDSGRADLEPFFFWQPWLYLFLVPAISMRLWAEERKSGTIELLMTLPVSVWDIVLGKFLAAWVFALVAVFLTFPIWVTVNYLGNPDNGLIISGYLSCVLLIGAFLALGSCMSALTNNQVIAFVVTVTSCFILNLTGLSMVLNFFSTIGFSQTMLDTVSSFSFLTNFTEINRGIISLGNVLFFLSMGGFWLLMNVLAVEAKK